MTPILLSAFSAFSSLCIGVGSIVFFFHSVCNLIGGIYADFAKPSLRFFAIMLLCLAIVPYLVMVGLGAREFYRIGELRLQYPVTSLNSRLSFEETGNQKDESEILLLDSDVEQRLAEFEQGLDLENSYRGIALSQLHNDTYRRFAAAEGFGPARMAMIPKKGRLDHLAYSRDPTALPLSLKSQANTSASVITESVHTEVLKDSFDSDSFGDITDSKYGAGFETHGPHHLNTAIGVMDDDDTASWQLTRLELVSLLRHDEPRVYVAETIPLMNELADIPHRALNKFEAEALPQLKTQRDTVIKETPDGAVMLGAVRAASDCLQCHNGPRGKLLGAFSYEFREVK